MKTANFTEQPYVRSAIRLDELSLELSDFLSENYRAAYTFKSELNHGKKVYISVHAYALIIKTLLCDAFGEDLLHIELESNRSDFILTVRSDSHTFSERAIGEIESLCSENGIELLNTGNAVSLKTALLKMTVSGVRNTRRRELYDTLMLCFPKEWISHN